MTIGVNTRGLFITGTDTSVGKTYVAAALARELRQQRLVVGAYKPVATGAIVDDAGQPHWADVEALAGAVGDSFEADRICPQRFVAPLAPPVSARSEGQSVDRALLRRGAAWWRGRVDVLLIEGVGGWLCPLAEAETVADLAADLRVRVLIVARQVLGTINHTLLTIEAVRSRGLKLAGVVLNEATRTTDDPSAATNADEIESRGGVPVLAVIPHAKPAGLLRDRHGRTIDWLELCGVVDGD